MSTVFPNIISNAVIQPAERRSDMGPTIVKDGDVVPFDTYPNFFKNHFFVRRDNNATVVYSVVPPNAIIGVNVPPLANTEIVGMVSGG